MRMMYFAWLREKIGKSTEELTPPATVITGSDLIAWMSTQDQVYALAFENTKALKIAINQEMSTMDAPIPAGAEVALFPPVTGG